jgi:hypothetical protein
MAVVGNINVLGSTCSISVVAASARTEFFRSRLLECMRVTSVHVLFYHYTM